MRFNKPPTLFLMIENCVFCGRDTKNRTKVCRNCTGGLRTSRNHAEAIKMSDGDLEFINAISYDPIDLRELEIEKEVNEKIKEMLE